MVLWEFGGRLKDELEKNVYLNSGITAPLLKRVENRNNKGGNRNGRK